MNKMKEIKGPVRLNLDKLPDIRATKTSSSLNDFPETGPPFQSSIWNFLVRSRFKTILLCGDIEIAF